MQLTNLISPKAFLILFGFLLSVDFLSFYFNQDLDIFSSYYTFDDTSFAWTIAYFISAFLASYLGLTLGERITISDKLHKTAPPTNFFVLIFSIIIVFYFLFLLLFFIQGISKQEFFYKFPPLTLISMSILYFYAYYLFLSQSSLKSKLLFTIFIVAGLIISGSRSSALFVLAGFILFYHINIHKISTMKVILMALSSIAFLLISRFYFRETYRYDSLSDYISDQGGVFSIFFETVEFSQAESLYVLVNFDEFFRNWYDSILAGFLYLIPRSFVEFKPLGASSFFTEITYPEKWYLTKSEIVISGFGDTFISFGWLGLVFLFFFFILIGGLYKHFTKSNSYYLIIILIYLEYSFLRGDLYNLAGKLWVLLLFLVVKHAFDVVNTRRT